jgi:hypothetical protein
MPGISTGLSRWEIEREKHLFHFFPFPDLTAPLSKVGRKNRPSCHEEMRMDYI